ERSFRGREHVEGCAAEDMLPQARMAVSTHDDEIGGETARLVEDDIGYPAALPLGGDDFRDHAMAGEMAVYILPKRGALWRIHDEDDRTGCLFDEAQSFAQGAGRLAAPVPCDQHGLDGPLPMEAGRHK